MNRIATKFVDTALNYMDSHGFMTCPLKPPRLMRGRPFKSKSGLYNWKAIPSKVTMSDIEKIEKEINHSYPPLYKDFLMYKYFFRLTEEGIRFPEHTPQNWSGTLTDLCFNSWAPERIIEIGLVPFGAESFWDAGPVCFDTREQMDDGDCPVVFWDHESIGSEDEVRTMFSSSQKMFQCLNFAASNETDFFYINSAEQDNQLSKKEELLDKFLSIDPLGAGGSGKAYWTSLVIDEPT